LWLTATSPPVFSVDTARNSAADKQQLEFPAKIMEARNRCQTFSGYVRRSVRCATSSTTAEVGLEDERISCSQAYARPIEGAIKSEQADESGNSPIKTSGAAFMKVESANDIDSSAFRASASRCADVEGFKTQIGIHVESEHKCHFIESCYGIANTGVIKVEQTDDYDLFAVKDAMAVCEGNSYDQTGIKTELMSDEYHTCGSSSDVVVKTEPVDSFGDPSMMHPLTAYLSPTDSRIKGLCTEPEPAVFVTQCKFETADQCDDTSAFSGIANVEAEPEYGVFSSEHADCRGKRSESFVACTCYELKYT
jgi:hypothetical protein